MLVWLEFLACTIVILWSGSRLSRYGDVVAEKTGMGRTWIGVVLLASVTSLPELIAGVSSVTVYNLPNIAAGEVLGSCLFNLLILAALDVGRRRAPISSLTHQGQVLTAAFGILLLGLTAISILASHLLPVVGWVGVSSVVLLVIYFVAMRIVFRFERRRIAAFLAEVRQEARYAHISKIHAYRRFALCAVLIVAAATYLPHVADEIAGMTGLSVTFVGSIFVALATSLPEIVVSRAALRMGSVDLAVGNVLGSNLFNVAILALADAFYLKGSLLSHVSPIHAITAAAAMTMTAILMIALVYRPKKKVLFFSWEALGIFLIYVLTVFVLLAKR
jgi:cation:H+ antiporter